MSASKFAHVAAAAHTAHSLVQVEDRRAVHVALAAAARRSEPELRATSFTRVARVALATRMGVPVELLSCQARLIATAMAMPYINARFVQVGKRRAAEVKAQANDVFTPEEMAA